MSRSSGSTKPAPRWSTASAFTASRASTTHRPPIEERAMKIVACIDASQYATSVVDHAAWAAGRLGATVEVLHVIQRKDAVAARHDLSGAVGLGARSGLLEELTRIDEAEGRLAREQRSEEHTSELQSLMRISYAVFCLKKK